MVTNGEFLNFVKAGGFAEKSLWTEAGWQWRSFRNVLFPTFWVRLPLDLSAQLIKCIAAYSSESFFSASAYALQGLLPLLAVISHFFESFESCSPVLKHIVADFTLTSLKHNLLRKY